MKNILITGGAGFIGSNLSNHLINIGYKVTVLDNLSAQIHGHNPIITSPLFNSLSNSVKFIKGCITSRTELENSIKNQDIIVHLAAETGTGQSMYEIENYNRVNSQGTALMLDVLVNVPNNVKKVIVASSRAIYGEGKYKCSEHGIVFPMAREIDDMKNGDFESKCPKCGDNLKLLPTCENSIINPNSVYGITKLNQEQMVHNVCKSIGISSISFRYQNVFGPGQSLFNPYTGILSIFSNLIRNDEAINIFEDGNQSRDFVFIDDVLNATTLGIETNKKINESYNVGSNKPIPVIKVANLLKKYYDSDVTISVSGNFRVGDIRHNYADLDKIKNDLDYYPKIEFEKGLKKFCEWVLDQDVKTSNYKKSIDEMKSKNLLIDEEKH